MLMPLKKWQKWHAFCVDIIWFSFRPIFGIAAISLMTPIIAPKVHV